MKLETTIDGNKTITKRIFCVQVDSKAKALNETLCQGVLKRIFSKQICFSYQIERFYTKGDSFLILFRFVCWNKEGQRERYKTFLSMDQSKIEEQLLLHKNKSVDNFCGEFFKRLKKGNFDVEIEGRKVMVYENKNY